MEGYGENGIWTQLTLEIEYAIDGDYAESDAHPFEVNVYEKDGKIYAERVRRRGE